jgi:hypothetical protein
MHRGAQDREIIATIFQRLRERDEEHEPRGRHQHQSKRADEIDAHAENGQQARSLVRGRRGYQFRLLVDRSRKAGCSQRTAIAHQCERDLALRMDFFVRRAVLLGLLVACFVVVVGIGMMCFVYLPWTGRSQRLGGTGVRTGSKKSPIVSAIVTFACSPPPSARPCEPVNVAPTSGPDAAATGCRAPPPAAFATAHPRAARHRSVR